MRDGVETETAPAPPLGRRGGRRVAAGGGAAQSRPLSAAGMRSVWPGWMGRLPRSLAVFTASTVTS